MGRGAAEVEAGDRRARREPVLPHLVGHGLALEDVAAGEADAVLDVRRCRAPRCARCTLDVGREAGDQVDELLPMASRSVVPRAPVERVRAVLPEDAHEVPALGRG